MEAEVRIILEQAVFPVDRVRFGDSLQSIGQSLNLSDSYILEIQETLVSTSDMEPLR